DIVIVQPNEVTPKIKKSESFFSLNMKDSSNLKENKEPNNEDHLSKSSSSHSNPIRIKSFCEFGMNDAFISSSVPDQALSMVPPNPTTSNDSSNNEIL